jgi:hypothetical protein
VAEPSKTQVSISKIKRAAEQTLTGKHHPFSLRHTHITTITHTDSGIAFQQINKVIKTLGTCIVLESCLRNNPQVAGDIRVENTHTIHTNKMKPISFCCSKLGYVFLLYFSVYIDLLYEK